MTDWMNLVSLESSKGDVPGDVAYYCVCFVAYLVGIWKWSEYVSDNFLML